MDNQLSVPDLSELLRVAEAAAIAAGEVARSFFGKPIRVERKPDGSEVSAADEAAQDAALHCIRTSRPNDALITEEVWPVGPIGGVEARPPKPSHQGVCWLIDPIDGTRNYIRGVPDFAASVGVMFGGIPIAGAIYLPMRDALYSRAVHSPLQRKGGAAGIVPALVSADPRLKRLIAAIPSKCDGPAQELTHRWVDRFVTRSYGSAALHLAYVAAGHFQAALFSDAKLWDLAAGAALLADSGGGLFDFSGISIFPLDLNTYENSSIPCIAVADAANLDELLRQ